MSLIGAAEKGPNQEPPSCRVFFESAIEAAEGDMARVVYELADAREVLFFMDGYTDRVRERGGSDVESARKMALCHARIHLRDGAEEWQAVRPEAQQAWDYAFEAMSTLERMRSFGMNPDAVHRALELVITTHAQFADPAQIIGDRQ